MSHGASADWTEDWKPLVDAVGTEFDTDDRPGKGEQIELSSVLRYLEPLEFDCPLHYDRETARAHGYDDVVVPYSALLSFTAPPVWAPGDPPVFRTHEANAQPEGAVGKPPATGLEPDVSGYFATDIGMQYLRPVTVGDSLRRVGYKLLSCVPKETSVGRGAFTKWETQILDQHDETVAKVFNGLFQYEPAANGAAAQPAKAREERLDTQEETGPAPGPDVRRQPRWEDIAEGDELPAQDFPITVYRLVMEAGANRDFNAIHHNRDVARSTGAADMYANNIFLQGMWERTVRSYIGLEGRIHALDGFRMRSFNTVGDTVRTTGRVQRKWADGERGFVEIAMQCRNAHGISVGPGTMTASLPRGLQRTQ